MRNMACYGFHLVLFRQWGSFLLDKNETYKEINYNISPSAVYHINTEQHDNSINDATNIIIQPQLPNLIIRTTKQTVDGTYILWCGIFK